MSTVFFLAAGFGTRLRPLTDHVPKALVPVGGEPQLLRLARRYAGARLVVNAHHHADRIAEAIAGHGIELSREADVLGTAGGIRAARPWFEPGPVLVHNADIEVPRSVLEPSDAASTLLVSGAREPGVGNVGLDAERRVVRLRQERGPGEETASCNYLGVALLQPALLDLLPEVGCLVGDAWIPALRRGAVLRAVPEAVAVRAEAAFFDLGTPASYLAANLAWLHEHGLRVRAEAGAKLHPACTDVVAGAGAQLLAPATRVVAWAGARCTEPVQDAIVTPYGVVSGR